MPTATSTRASELDRAGVLAALGLDAEFVRGEGSALFERESPLPVWDFVGGYGAAFFGHNHPQLVGVVADFLRASGVVQAQASIRRPAAELASRLAARLRASTGRSYRILLLNTGAEAVERAARHAELIWLQRRDELSRWGRSDGDGDVQVRWSRAAVAQLDRLGLAERLRSDADIRRHNESVLRAPPVQLALRRGFHGCTTRASELTWNAAARFGARLGVAAVRFIDPQSVQELAGALAQLTSPVFRARPGADGHELDSAMWTAATAFILEPLQGEGGIHALNDAQVGEWQRACRAHGVPIIADEIQSGMGRTGTFLYGEQIGLTPDYILLGKSLGGGLAKISAVAVDEHLHVPRFELQYMSTFAEDDLSSRVALRALELLEEDDALARAAERGGCLRDALEEVAARYPAVLDGVSGSGLMLGLGWRAQPFDRSAALRFLQKYGWLGYAIAGYLLRRWRIRVAPALSHGATMRLEPSYDLPDAAIAQLANGLEDVCGLLERQDAAALLAPALGVAVPPHPLRPVRPAVIRATSRGPHVGFIGHFIDADGVALWDASFQRVDQRARRTFLERVRPFAEPLLCHRDEVRSATGQVATLSFIGIPVSAEQCHDALGGAGLEDMRALIQRAVDMAADERCKLVGLGGYCSILTRNGKSVERRGMGVTTGNGFTVASALLALHEQARIDGLALEDARAAIIGANGNIGSVLASLLACEVGALTLVGRAAHADELWRAAGRIVGRLLRECPDAPVLGALRRTGFGIADDAGEAELVAACRGVQARCGDAAPIVVSPDPARCRDAQVIVSASNEPRAILMPGHLSDAATFIIDLAVPADVHPTVEVERPNVRLLRGGVVRTPYDPHWQIGGIPLEPGEMFACMAETVMMGFENERTNGSVGALTPERVRHALQLAREHGFTTVRTAAVSAAGQLARRLA